MLMPWNATIQHASAPASKAVTANACRLRITARAWSRTIAGVKLERQSGPSPPYPRSINSTL
jgi:hypothetical protein